MIILWDALKSLLAALLTLVICGGPAGLAALALRGRIVPDYAIVPGWIVVVALAAAGLVLTFAFLRKAWRGVSPGRDRRR